MADVYSELVDKYTVCPIDPTGMNYRSRNFAPRCLQLQPWMFPVDDYEIFRCFEPKVGGIHLWNVSLECRFDGHPVWILG